MIYMKGTKIYIYLNALIESIKCYGGIFHHVASENMLFLFL